MTSIEPESTLEWPLTPQEWKNNYDIYRKSIAEKKRQGVQKRNEAGRSPDSFYEWLGYFVSHR